MLTLGLGNTPGAGLGRQRATMGDNGFGNFGAGEHPWGRARETTGNNGFGNFGAGEHPWGRALETTVNNGRKSLWLFVVCATPLAQYSGDNGLQSV